MVDQSPFQPVAALSHLCVFQGKKVEVLLLVRLVLISMGAHEKQVKKKTSKTADTQDASSSLQRKM